MFLICTCSLYHHNKNQNSLWHPVSTLPLTNLKHNSEDTPIVTFITETRHEKALTI